MLRTSFTLAEKFFSLVINLSHLRRVLRGSVLGPWRLREDEHNERFRPFEPQIRRQGTAVESETAVAARRLIKGSRWSVKCVRGGGGGRREGGGERNEEAYLWLWPETAVSLRRVEDGSSLISFPSRHSIYVASLPSSVGRRATPSPEREGKSMPPPQSITPAEE